MRTLLVQRCGEREGWVRERERGYRKAWSKAEDRKAKITEERKESSGF